MYSNRSNDCCAADPRVRGHARRISSDSCARAWVAQATLGDHVGAWILNQKARWAPMIVRPPDGRTRSSRQSAQVEHNLDLFYLPCVSNSIIAHYISLFY